MDTQTDWRKIVKKYNRVDNTKSYWQVLSTLTLYVLSWFIAYEAYQVSLWLCFAVALVSQTFFGRIFIFMHDCGHGTLFKTKKQRTFWGYVTGVIWLTPYWQWTKGHATHHRNSGNLDGRGTGDIWTLTVEEYENGSPLLKLAYRVCRFPPFVIFFGGFYAYFLTQRFSHKIDGKRERRSVHLTNVLIVIAGFGVSLLTSASFVIFYQFLLVYLGSALAVVLFYVQHQFEDTYFEKKENWDYKTSAIEGCSVLKLPKALHWMTGNIGYHNIHHLSHTIPNYNLPRAYEENELFQNSTELRFRDFFRCFNLALYDVESSEMISFSEMKAKKSVDSSYKEMFNSAEIV